MSPAQEMITVVDLRPAKHTYRSTDGEVFRFTPADGMFQAQVPYLTARDMCRRPWIFFPYYEGMDVERHKEFTAHKKLNPIQADDLIRNPEQGANQLLGRTRWRPPGGRKNVEPPIDSAFGHPVDAGETPESKPEVEIKRKEQEGPADPFTVQRTVEIPRSLEEAETMDYGAKVDILRSLNHDLPSMPKAKMVDSLLFDEMRKRGVDVPVADSAKSADNPTGDSEQGSPTGEVEEAQTADAKDAQADEGAAGDDEE